jgi:hypothetical protein
VGRCSVTASLLPIPDDPRFSLIQEMWTDGRFSAFPHPRSRWLSEFERLLREFYPSANAASLKLTARHSAPFYLRDGPNVP